MTPASLLSRRHCLLCMYHNPPVLTCLLRSCCMLVVMLDLRSPSSSVVWSCLPICELSHSENLNCIFCTLSCVGTGVSSPSGCYAADDWTETSFNAGSQEASQSAGGSAHMLGSSTPGCWTARQKDSTSLSVYRVHQSHGEVRA